MKTIASNKSAFTYPEFLQAVQPALLLTWMRRFETYLARRGLCLPQEPPWPPEALDRLAAILADPHPEAPPALAESIYLVHGMSEDPAMDALLAAARQHHLPLARAIDEACTPADVAVQCWLEAPRVLEEAHHAQLMLRPRAFRFFSGRHECVPFPGPAPEQLRALEQRLRVFYKASRRGGGVRVFTYFREGEWWFLVRHGLAMRRAAALREEQPAAVVYRPCGYAVAVYDPDRVQIRVHCGGEPERKALLRAFGYCLFGTAEFFPLGAQYTLAPLLERGRDCLACADVPGIERVSLTEVEFFCEGAPYQHTIKRSDDIFSLIEQDHLQWPPCLDQIRRATFRFKIAGAPRSRRVTIVPSNKIVYGRDEDSTWVKYWLRAREFAR
jgi:hypothetical protein